MSAEDELRTRFHQAAEALRVPTRELGQAFRRSERMRARKRVAEVVGVSVVLALLGASIWVLLPLGKSHDSVQLGAASDSPTATVSPSEVSPTHPNWLVYSVGEGVSIEAPSDWSIEGPGEMPLLSPQPVLMAGTWPFPAGGDCAPTAALDSMPRDGALIWVLEYPSVDDAREFGPRPEHFSLGDPMGPFECVGRKTYLVLFRDEARFFQIHIVIGPEASDSVRSDVLEVLDSLQIEKQA
jgi:hypothetical protein